MAKLGDVCTINPKAPLIDDTTLVSFVPMPKVGEEGEFDPSETRPYADVKKGFTYFAEGDVLFAKITPCMENGKGAVARGLENGHGCGSTEFHVLRPNREQILEDWLYYLTAWPSFRKEAERNMTGSAGQKRVPKDFLENYRVNVPALSEQQHQVKTLNELCALISLRKQQIAKLDELVKARFVEIFGDPVTNPMNWNIVTIGSTIISCESGWSGNGVQRIRKPGEIAVLKVSAVTKGYFIPEECKVLDDQDNIKKYVFPEKGDLLFSRANTRELVGATAMVLEDYPELILPDKLWKLRFDDQCSVYFMKHILSCSSIREQFSSASTGTSGSMYNVSMEKFREITIPLPPLDLQHQFAAFVAQTDQQKLTIQHSLDKLELLKKALMQKYFG